MALQECTLNLDASRRELCPHGTLAFPCAGHAARYTGRAEEEIPWHWHEEMELLCVTQGAMEIGLPGKKLCLRAGEGVFLNSGVLHRASAAPACDTRSLVFSVELLAGGSHSVFSQKYLEPLKNCPALDGCALTAKTDWEREGLACFAAAFAAMEAEEPGYEFAVRERLSRICLLLWRQCGGEPADARPQAGPDRQRICRMIDYIHAHYAENLSLAEIAQAGGIGERECLRCFGRVIRISPMQYLLKYRIMQGAAMLAAHSERGVAEVSTRCGFDSPSNFSKMFKRFFARTPKEYRSLPANDSNG